MTPKIWINKIKFSDNSEITFTHNQITVFVGPNNAGKSATLKELNALTETRNKKGNVINDFQIKRDGTLDELKEFVQKQSIENITSNPEPYYKGYKYNIYGGSLSSSWTEGHNLDSLQPLFVNLLTTEERLSISNPPNSISLTKEAVSHPIHFMQKDDSIEQKFSAYFKQAFNEDLIVHRNAGKNVPLYIGERPIPKEGDDRVSVNYLQELEKLPLLHEQGDGMRSFVGVLLSAFISNHSLLLIDEPEAFFTSTTGQITRENVGKRFTNKQTTFFSDTFK